MEITLEGVSYEYRTSYQEEPTARQSLAELTRQTFGLDLERWYQAGHWTDKYRSYSLFRAGQVVASLSVTPMDLRLMGRPLHLVQLGTVVSHPSVQGKGLIHFLMARAFADWSKQCDGFYLYASQETEEFFAKFGFEKLREVRHTMPIAADGRRHSVRRLIPEISQDKSLILSRYQRGNPFALLTWEHNPGLLFFYLGSALREHIYYVSDCDAVVVAEYDGNTLLCHEVLGGSGHTLSEILTQMARPETEKVMLGFTPREGAQCSVRPLRDKSAILCAQGKAVDLFQRFQLRMPILSHT